MPNWNAQQKILQELDTKLHQIEDRLEEIPTKDFEDFAQESAENEVMEGLGNACLKEIEIINVALQRIVDGIYGECQNTAMTSCLSG